MGTLAYDPEQLRLLASALVAAADSLDALASTDPQAQPALGVASAASAVFTAWADQAVRLAGCGALDGYVPVVLEPGDLVLAAQWVLANGYGWITTTDPTGFEWQVPPAMQAAAVGVTLANGGVRIDTPEALFSLQMQLQAAAADPQALAALLANLPLDAVVTLTQRLAERRVDLAARGGGPPGSDLARDAEHQAEVAQIDAIAAVLANVLIGEDTSLDAAKATLAAFRPYTAAMLVGQLRGNDELVADLARETLLRYRDSFADPDLMPEGWEVRDRLFLGPGDFLFPRIAAGSPVVAWGFVADLLRVDPTLLLVTAHEPASTANLVLRATDPAAIDVADAGRIVPPYLDLLRDQPASEWLPVGFRAAESESWALRPSLGVLVAPWLFQFASRAADWGWSETEATEAFHFVIDDETAFEDLAAAADRWDDTLVLLDVSDPDALLTNLQQIGSLVGTIGTLLALREAEQLADDRALWDLVVKNLPKAINKALGETGLTGIPAKISAKVVALVVAQGGTYAEERGVLGAPPPLDESLRELDVRADQAVAVGAYLAMGLMVESLIAEGRLPPDTAWPPEPVTRDGCPSGTYVDRTNEWMTETFDDDFDARAAVTAARGAFMSDLQSKATCAELRFG